MRGFKTSKMLFYSVIEKLIIFSASQHTLIHFGAEAIDLPLLQTPALISDVCFYAVAEDPGGGGHVQGGGGRHPPAGVRAQSGWDGGRDPGAGGGGRGAVQRGAQHDLSSGLWNLQRRPRSQFKLLGFPRWSF